VVERGTAYRLAGVTPAIAGKTGTAQVVNGQPHAWFIGYAPYGGGEADGARAAHRLCGADRERRLRRRARRERRARIVTEAGRLGIL